MDDNPVSGPQSKNLVDRVKAILTKPAQEWPQIEAENSTIADIFTKYVLPLAAIGPISLFIGSQIFGFGALGFTYRPSFTSALGTAVTSYVIALISIAVLAFLINVLAPRFDGKENKLSAVKLAAYSMTAGWVAGILGLIPSLGIIGALAGLYGIYLFYLGAPTLMKVPQDKAAGYTAVTIIAAIILFFIASTISSTVAGLFGHRPYENLAESGEMSGTVSIPGMGSINLDKAQKAADRAEKMANGEIKPVAIDALKTLLPASIGAYTRTSVDSMSAGGMSNASGTYANGDSRFDLRISDTNALGALGGIGAAMGVEQSSESEDGYDRTQVVDGRMQTEKWSKSGSNGTFGVLLADRFMVEAEGSVPNIDVLKQAVSSIDASALAKLAGS
ncbi:Yip1 family protein [Caenibius tardaugens]|nr:Yip1 family protein [Caenibius tardaugens]